MAPQEQDELYPPGDKPGAAKSSPYEPSPAEETKDVGSAETSAQDDLLSEILAGLYRAEGMTAQGFALLQQRLGGIERQLGIVPEDEETADDTEPPSDDSSTVETFPEAPADDAVAESAAEPTAAAEPLPPMAQPAPAEPLPQPVQPVQDVRPAAAPQAVAAQGHGGDLERLVFGSDLAYHESLLGERQAIVVAASRGHEDAVGLIGQLLIVRSATMDRLPTLLKDVGEAWYRWRGERGDADPMRDALIAWLHGRLDAVGLGNRIDLVRVGDRYDSKRHNAKARGVEVTGVQGWVVLRDNGNVYTKANVVVA